MLWSTRTNGLDSLVKEVMVLKAKQTSHFPKGRFRPYQGTKIALLQGPSLSILPQNCLLRAIMGP